MSKLVIARLASVALIAGCGGEDDDDVAGADTEASELAGDPVIFQLSIDEEGPQGDATVTLTPVAENETAVDIEFPLTESGDEPKHPAHIHDGGCGDELGDIAYPLEDVSGGSSQSTLDVGLDELQSSDYAINVHKSADEMDVYLACGTIP